MLSFQHKTGLPLCDGISRREWLRVGGIGLGGLSLSSLLNNQTLATDYRPPSDQGTSFGKAKSVIVFNLNGGVPQHETWDPKPNAPQDIRGEFGVISTSTPGYHVGELMPQVAKLTDRLAVLRAVVTHDNNHSSSGYQMLTGVEHIPLSRENALPVAPNLSPSLAAMVRALRKDKGLPSAMVIPEHIWNDGNIPWPGQMAGVLGRRHDPWLIKCHPQEDRFDVPGMSLPEDISAKRVLNRKSLLDQINRQGHSLQGTDVVQDFKRHTQKAFDLLGSAATGNAFDLSQETSVTRDRYGHSRFSQSCLLARRLVESGVSLVQVNWTRVIDENKYENGGGWDTHKKHNQSLKEHLMPVMDQTLSALIEDLEQRGLLDETLVLIQSEFGHTPKFNARAGRDHWGSAFSIAMAGGGIQGGVVHGKTDAHAAFPVDDIVRPRDILATVFHLLGYEPHTEILDPLNRPIRISHGKVINEILG